MTRLRHWLFNFAAAVDGDKASGSGILVKVPRRTISGPEIC
jgi:hypothetical protein